MSNDIDLTGTDNIAEGHSPIAVYNMYAKGEITRAEALRAVYGGDDLEDEDIVDE